MSRIEIISRIEALLRETYGLWDPGWVTFNWRNYTYDHVQRVRGLALNLAASEGADAWIVELAALLHDLTKPYDGEYATDADGRRLVDERGLWHNLPRPPARQNRVTALYDELGLSGTLHNESGAVLAKRLLIDWGLPHKLAERVATTIRDHLVLPEDAPIESRCLSDADTIDANIGLPAFVRNIYINLHFYDERRGPEDAPIADTLASDPQRFLGPYIGENLPRWSASKRRDFVCKLATGSAVRLAEARLDRLDRLFGELKTDLGQLPPGEDHSRIDIVLHYMHHTDDPSMWAETERLHRTWPEAGAPACSVAMIEALRTEMLGQA